MNSPPGAVGGFCSLLEGLQSHKTDCLIIAEDENRPPKEGIPSNDRTVYSSFMKSAYMCSRFEEGRLKERSGFRGSNN